MSPAPVPREADADSHAAAPGEGGEPQGPPKTIWREYFESGVVTFIMALFFMTFVAQAAEVPSASMENTIYVGDHFLINKFIFAPGPPLPFLPQRDIRRGDIIVFKYPSEIDTNETVEQYKTFYIKRVIGLPGDRIEVRGANVLINGQVLPEHRITANVIRQSNDKAPLEVMADPPRRNGEEPYNVYYDPATLERTRSGAEVRDTFFKYAVNGQSFVVPADSYFVMGDNRDNSSDSRRWGTVPRELVVGRALFVIWSYDKSAPSSGNFILDFFKNTRWGRTGTLIK